MAKKVLWIVAAAAAVALITMRVAGYPPVEKGTEATIGAAQRYQAPQISSADVKTAGCAAPGIPAERPVPSARPPTRRRAGAEEQGLPARAGRRRRARGARTARRPATQSPRCGAANNGARPGGAERQVRSALSAKYAGARKRRSKPAPHLRAGARVGTDVVAAMAASDALRVALAKPDAHDAISQPTP